MGTAIRAVLPQLLVLALLSGAGCGGEVAAPTSTSSPAPTASSSDGSGGGGGEGGGAEEQPLPCGGYAWGKEWPPAGAPPRVPAPVPPDPKGTDCGPGCRTVARSVHAADLQPYGLHFEGRRFMPSSPIARYIELDTAEAFDGLSGERPFGVLPSMYVFAQSWMGKDSVAMAFVSSDNETRTYVCQLALDREVQRLLADGSGLPYDRQFSLIESDVRHVVLSLGDEIFALDTADGSRHPLTEAPPYRVTNLSVIAPRIVFAGPDGDVHAVNMETWADEKLTQDPTQQDMAASDGERVAWVDLHESPPEVPMSDIVVYSLADKTTTRLEAPASSKLYPTVEGDWVAWMDDRDSDTPNNPNGYGGYAIYGYNLKTKKEVVLVPWTANTWVQPSLPRLHHGKLYVLIGGSRYGPPWLVEQAMPEPE